MPSLLRRALLAFDSPCGGGARQRWLIHCLAVVVNYASHDDASRQSLLTHAAVAPAMTTRSKGKGKGRQAHWGDSGAASGGAESGVGASLLHALLSLHRRRGLSAVARGLCGAALKSALTEEVCRGVIVKVHPCCLHCSPNHNLNIAPPRGCAPLSHNLWPASYALYELRLLASRVTPSCVARRFEVLVASHQRLVGLASSA